MSGASNQTAAALKIAEEAPDVEWKVSHESLASALVHALADLTVIEKGRTVNIETKTGARINYGYADIADVVKKTRPVLARHGLVALTPLLHVDSNPACSVVFVHEGGETMTFGPFPFQHGRDAQATGSWVTYMRRYALVAALGMAAGDDDDGAAAQPRQASAPPAADQPKHPLRVECDLLEDDGEVWQSFLTRAGVADGDADMVLTDHPTWREWLSGAIEHHRAGEQSS